MTPCPDGLSADNGPRGQREQGRQMGLGGGGVGGVFRIPVSKKTHLDQLRGGR